MTETRDHSTRRPIVLAFASHYLPGYKAGGPIRTLHNLTSGLGDEFDFRIVTSDRDFGDSRPFPGIAANRWTAVGKASVLYADATGRSPRRLAALITEIDPDVVYVNSFFSPRSSILPLVLRRLGLTPRRTSWIIAPRGEFSPGALAIKAPRKRVYLSAAKLLGLHRDLLWQASTEHEARDIREAYGTPAETIRIAPNLTAAVEASPPLSSTPRTAADRLSVCFLARVCAMKNLAFAVETLSRCRCDVELHVYGPIEDEAYAVHCRKIARSGPSPLEVNWHGSVPNERVRSVLAGHDVFFLPTLGENFGHGIFEALAAGTPVLVSDRTPWRDLDDAGVGWVRPLEDLPAFVDVIERLATMAPEARAAMRREAHAYAARIAESSESRERHRVLFRDALTRR